MSASGSDATSDERSFEITVSKDELEMLQLFRSMKRGTRLEAGETIHAPSPPGPAAEAAAAFDQALVIAHHAQADHLHLGLVRLAAQAAQSIELLPITSPNEYGQIEELWDRLTSEETAVKDKSRRRFLRYAAAQLESAEAAHRRARAVIESHRETRRRAEEVSRRTEELLRPD